MRAIIVAATLVSAVCLGPERATAVTVLTSDPLPGGAGGVVCSCTNPTDAVIAVEFSIRSSVGGNYCHDKSVTMAQPQSCSLTGTSVRTCTVAREDGKSASTRQLRCNFFALDAEGNPTAVVPVNIKMKE